jgi:hypothetical protein
MPANQIKRGRILSIVPRRKKQARANADSQRYREHDWSAYPRKRLWHVFGSVGRSPFLSSLQS